MLTTLLGLFILTRIPPSSEAVPNKQPQLAASRDTVAMVYGSGKSIMFSQSKDQGATFSTPVPIAELPVLAAGRHRGPRVVFSSSTILVSAIGGKTVATGQHAHGLPADGDLLLWRSTPTGWSAPVSINDSPGSAREGLHAIAADDTGHVAAVWLDLRGNGTKLYGAYSKDAGATWSKNFLVYESPDGTICQCCHPSLAALGNGEFTVMFRNVMGGSRDMYILRLREDTVTAKPVKVGVGSWKINACPMDGGGLAHIAGRSMMAWRRGEDIFLLSDAGKEKKIGTGKDVALTAHGNNIVAAWTQEGRIEAWINGKPQTLSPAGAFPSLVSLPNGSTLAAWEQDGAITLQKLN